MSPCSSGSSASTMTGRPSGPWTTASTRRPAGPCGSARSGWRRGTTCCASPSSTGSGHLQVGDLAVVIAVGAVHRAPALAACADLIDTVKAEVPIWKEQVFASGESDLGGSARRAEAPTGDPADLDRLRVRLLLRRPGRGARRDAGALRQLEPGSNPRHPGHGGQRADHQGAGHRDLSDHRAAGHDGGVGDPVRGPAQPAAGAAGLLDAAPRHAAPQRGVRPRPVGRGGRGRRDQRDEDLAGRRHRGRAAGRRAAGGGDAGGLLGHRRAARRTTCCCPAT